MEIFAGPWTALVGALMLVLSATILAWSAFVGGGWLLSEFRRAERTSDRFATAFMAPLGVLAWLAVACGVVVSWAHFFAN